MSDPGWTDVDADIDGASMQLERAIRTFDAGFSSGVDFEDWQKSNAFLHGMETGYTGIETAIKRIMDMLRETLPTGDHWHKSLIDRVSREMPGADGRPAIFGAGLKSDLLELMRMRHRARNAMYDEFTPEKAVPSVEAARRVLTEIRSAILKFKDIVDPDPGEDNDGGSAPATPPI